MLCQSSDRFELEESDPSIRNLISSFCWFQVSFSGAFICSDHTIAQYATEIWKESRVRWHDRICASASCGAACVRPRCLPLGITELAVTQNRLA